MRRGICFSKKLKKMEPPVAMLEQGKSPLLSIKPTFSPQSYFSDITGIEGGECWDKGF